MSYGTFAGFVTYHTERGTNILLFDETDVEAALIVASTALDARYRSGFSGEKTGLRAQVEEWPRTGAYDIYLSPIPSDEVPREVEQATYELALRQLLSPGSLSLSYTPSKFDSVSVDGAVSVTYSKFDAAMEIQTRFQIVDEIMSTLLVKSASGLSGDVYR